jgi:hypothetical protein
MFEMNFWVYHIPYKYAGVGKNGFTAVSTRNTEFFLVLLLLLLFLILTYDLSILDIVMGTADDGAVVKVPVLQIRRSLVRLPMVSLEFFIHIILLIALWPWESTQPLTERSTRSISWGVKAAGA